MAPFALAGCAAVAVAVLPTGLVLTAHDTDVIRQFIAWRSFAAERILAGDFPFWNPHTYAGQPFLSGFQSALFYPPNVLFLLLPVERAINLSFLWHLLWLGAGMTFWARVRGLDARAAALAGFVLPLSGPVFPHVYAGHLSNVCTMAWAPWVFAGLEQAWRGSRRGVPLAAIAVAMQILAGHVQYAFYTGLAVGLFALVTLAVHARMGVQPLMAVTITYLIGVSLAAVQVLPSLAASGEVLRGGRALFEYVQIFSFPPENVITAIAPGFFGSLTVDPAAPLYWGRAYLWEMTVFPGVCGVVLALAALDDLVRRRSRSLCYVAIPAVLGVCALGAYTPLLRVLYDWVPGFASFRGLSKFTFTAMLFMALAIAAGADTVLRGRLPSRVSLAVIGGAGLLLVTAGAWLLAEPGSAASWLEGIRRTGESGLLPALFGDAAFVERAGAQAGTSLAVAGLILLTMTVSLHLAVRRPPFRYLSIAVLPVEMCLFAGAALGTSSVEEATPDVIRQFVTANPGDYRIVNGLCPNNGFLVGASDAGGNDPGVLRRYAEYVTASEGGHPDQATPDLPFSRLGAALAMLRVRYAFVPYHADVAGFENPTPPLPHVLLVSRYRVVPAREDLLREVLRDDFDPRQVVLLEREPVPGPIVTDTLGTAQVISETSDTIEIQVSAPAPLILLVTDPYSRDWRARPLGGGSQESYEVLPANYVLRAIPLATGNHRLLLEYRPTLFLTGAVISLATSTGLFLVSVTAGRRRGLRFGRR